MKTSFLLLTIIWAFALPSALAAPSRKLKGAKQSKDPSNFDNNHRILPEKGPKARKFIQGPNERECDYSIKLQDGTNTKKQSQQVKFACKAKTTSTETLSRGMTIDPASIRDKIQYKVSTDKKGVRVKVEYRTEYEEEEGMNEFNDTKTSFEVTFESIVEYAKPDDDGSDRSDAEQAYDWDEDTILQTIELSQWANFTNVTDSVDGIQSSFSVKSLHKLAMFTFTISRADIAEHITANTMKIDVRITNFPWIRNDTNLALMSTVKTENKVEMSYNDQATYDRNGNLEKKRSKWAENVQISFEEATDSIGFVPLGDYTWDDQAEAVQTNASTTTLQDLMDALCTSSLLEQEVTRSLDPNATVYMPPGCENATLPPEEEHYIIEEANGVQVVGTSPPAALYGNETRQQIAYSFVGEGSQHAEEIYWDPEAGIAYVEGETSAAASLSSLWTKWSTTVVLVGSILCGTL